MTQPARVFSIGTAVPETALSQESAAAHALAVGGTHKKEALRTGALRALYRRAGVRSRGTVLPSAGFELSDFYRADAPLGPSTAERMRIFRSHAGRLAEQAVRIALARSPIEPSQITHIVTVSCTGFDAPGIDQFLMRQVGIPVSARRINVGFMGCHAAVNALAVAESFARLDPINRVLVVCIELCSLHFSYADDTERRVANALFADGAAAAIIGVDENPETSAPAIARFGSILIPQTEDLMGWQIGDHGFEMNLSPTVPGVLAKAVPSWIHALLGEEGYTTNDIAGWAIHPGGPRLLTALVEALGLPRGADAESRAVLAEHGNMSSATVLFIIERILQHRADRSDGLPLLAAAFGPGLAGEVMILT